MDFMAGASKRIDDKQPRVGRDVMKLLEYSVASASERVDRKTKELVFSEPVKNPVTGEVVDRVVRLAFSASYGRPTPKDDQVLVACYQIARQSDFQNKREYFSRRMICNILGWNSSGRYLNDIDKAFDRWKGVSGHAENFFFDERTESFVDRKFGIFDQIELQKRERQNALKRIGEEARSWFEWSEVMRESFMFDKVKRLDMDLHNRIENGGCKKLYRYLDMYFWRNRKQEFVLPELMHRKLGFNRINDNYELKRRITPWIDELVELRYLKPDADRFSGKRVRFEAGPAFTKGKGAPKEKTTRKKSATLSDVASSLVALGITKKDAIRFEKLHDGKRIADDVDYVLWLESQGKVRESKAGLLFTHLNSESPLKRRDDYVSKEERAAKAKRLEEKRKAREIEELKKEEASKREAEERKGLVEAKLSMMDAEQREEFFKEALAANSFLAKQFQSKLRDGDEERISEWRQMILESYICQEDENASSERV